MGFRNFQIDNVFYMLESRDKLKFINLRCGFTTLPCYYVFIQCWEWCQSVCYIHLEVSCWVLDRWMDSILDFQRQSFITQSSGMKHKSTPSIAPIVIICIQSFVIYQKTRIIVGTDKLDDSWRCMVRVPQSLVRHRRATHFLLCLIHKGLASRLLTSPSHICHVFMRRSRVLLVS